VKLQLPNPEPFVFPAISETQRRSIPMSFRQVEATDADWLRSVWKDMANAAKKAHQLVNEPVPRWLNWQPWQWCYEKAPIEAGRVPVLASVDGFPVGFLSLWLMEVNHVASLYVEHMGATPGDMTTRLWNRRYHKVGWSLFAYAIHVSRKNGMDGRVGLHAETDFVRRNVYGKYESACPGLFSPDITGIAGPTPYGPQKNLGLIFLETTKDGAGQFLEGFRA
jgi:hypothetical protein